MSISKDHIIQYGLTTGLVFLLLVGVFAFVSRDNLFRFVNDPRVPFQTYVPPVAADYDRKAAWVRAPVPTEDTSIFVVTPTVYWGGRNWNTPLDAPKPLERLLRVAVPNWAALFANAGVVSIPFYRSASLFSFLTVRNDARDARKLAYRDVLRAFDAFIAQTKGDGPIILAGTEQGGLHVLGLLQDRFNDPYLRERLAVAYVLDFAVPLDLFETGLKGFSPCMDETDARCIVTYGAFQKTQTAEIKRFKERTMVWDEQGQLHETKGRTLTCVNPVLGAASTAFAPKSLHKGGVAATGLEWGTAPAPLPAQTSTQCVDGILMINRPQARSLRKSIGFGARFKPDPFNLFYIDLADDAQRRMANLKERFKAEGRLAPPFEDSLEILDSPIRGVPGG